MTSLIFFSMIWGFGVLGNAGSFCQHDTGPIECGLLLCELILALEVKHGNLFRFGHYLFKDVLQIGTWGRSEANHLIVVPVPDAIVLCLGAVLELVGVVEHRFINFINDHQVCLRQLFMYFCSSYYGHTPTKPSQLVLHLHFEFYTWHHH